MEETVFIGDNRRMPEVESASTHLIVTSPPYWNLKDYGVPGQTGYPQTLHAYLRDLYSVWQECYRCLKPGRRLVVNIGDVFLSTKLYKRFRIVPIHAEIIMQALRIGFDYHGKTIWVKDTKINASHGQRSTNMILGSYPYPPNGVVRQTWEYLLHFKKPGRCVVDRRAREASELTQEEWADLTDGLWYINGASQREGHPACFPLSIPDRLIRAFSVVGETVGDPFMGSGTTAHAARDNDRRYWGYELNPEFVDLPTSPGSNTPPPLSDYTPSLPNIASPFS